MDINFFGPEFEELRRLLPLYVDEYGLDLEALAETTGHYTVDDILDYLEDGYLDWP